MKKSLLTAILLAAFVIGCVKQLSYDEAIVKINEINSKYGSTIESYPASTEQVNQMLSEFKELKSARIRTKQEQFDYAVNYRILSLEAGALFLEGTKHGTLGTTKDGFSCRPRPIIIESAMLRNKSAQKGYEAVNLLWEFVEEYPADAQALGLSAKTAIFQNASLYQIESQARSDVRVINNFCPENRTLEVYKDYLRGREGYSEDFINNLSYNQASAIWKKIRGFE